MSVVNLDKYEMFENQTNVFKYFKNYSAMLQQAEFI
jgi:hypothetical protein